MLTSAHTAAQTNEPKSSYSVLESTGMLIENFQREVTMRLLVPPQDAALYIQQLSIEFEKERIQLTTSQFVLLVDRNPNVQAAFLFWASNGRYTLVGASPVSTGLPGTYEHFLTPLGVFDHSRANPDFRAEGTKNQRGFRGYGRKGMRVYDFGWVVSPRGWGNGAIGKLRLQMHATDPDLAEQLLGTPRSEGCVRIAASLNDFIDRYALLDSDYNRALENGDKLWVLRKDRTPTASPGRYLVVVESNGIERPAWSPLPAVRANVIPVKNLKR